MQTMKIEVKLNVDFKTYKTEEEVNEYLDNLEDALRDLGGYKVEACQATN